MAACCPPFVVSVCGPGWRRYYCPWHPGGWFQVAWPDPMEWIEANFGPSASMSFT